MDIKLVIGISFLISAVAVIAICMWFFLPINEQQQPPFERLTVEGTVMAVSAYGIYENHTIYNVTLDDENTYRMFFRIENAVVPPTQVTLRFYYDIIIYDDATLFDVYKIKSL